MNECCEPVSGDVDRTGTMVHPLDAQSARLVRYPNNRDGPSTIECTRGPPQTTGWRLRLVESTTDDGKAPLRPSSRPADHPVLPSTLGMTRELRAHHRARHDKRDRAVRGQGSNLIHDQDSRRREGLGDNQARATPPRSTPRQPIGTSRRLFLSHHASAAAVSKVRIRNGSSSIEQPEQSHDEWKI